MKNLHRKLNRRDGMTLLISLVGFLVAAMVSIVIVSAAVTATKRVTDDRKTTQANLTLQSAAQLVKEEMEGTTYTFRKTDDGKIDTANASPAGTFGEEMKDAIADINGSALTATRARTVTLKLSDNAVDDVTASFIMQNVTDELYWVYFTFTTENSDETIYLTMAAKVDGPKADGSYVISWISGSIMSSK